MLARLGLAVATGLAALALAGPVRADPIQERETLSNAPLIMVRDGCGRGYEQNRRGYCVPIYRSVYREPDWRRPPPPRYIPPPPPPRYYRPPGFYFGFGGY